MPYILKEYQVLQKCKIEDFLVQTVKLKEKEAISLLAKRKIYDQNNKALGKKQVISDGSVKVYVYEAITQGLKPLFDSFHFAIFDKPSGLKVHPSSINNEYTLLDEIQYHFGDNANLVHRIDAETSGLVLVSKNPYSEVMLKNMFEEKLYSKRYLALVENELKEDLEIDGSIKASHCLIKIKMQVHSDGKTSLTKIKPLYYDKKKNQTLVQAIPITGRQHQIRVHLDSIGHRIVGDPIYGIKEEDCNNILNRKITLEKRAEITGNYRLMLQANYLEFKFDGVLYKFTSKQKLIQGYSNEN
ncbi:MAG: RNA pseudouridine synthase [Campylobacteraceae bacterium]|nr:RNA pseudouridine synthase [Campylobacteraceae bacterium]